ncbi:class C sortase [Lacticaseibacillus sp. GG6-2]
MAKRKKKRLVGDILVIVIFFTGLAIFAYPFVANAVNNVIVAVRVKNDQERSKRNAKQQAAQRKADNEALAKNGLVPNADVFKRSGKISQSEKYLQRHLIGAVTIPSINVNVPLYDATNETLLQSGATVLPGTSYPTGGKNTHTVISAHSGLPTKTLFTDLEKVKKKQRFIITVGDKHLAYKVDRIQVIKPDNVEVLKIEAGRDIATLMTCTPYGINSHRLLVTGHRVPYTQALAKKVRLSDDKRWWQSLAFIIAAIAAAVIAIGLGIRAVRRYRRNH